MRQKKPSKYDVLWWLGIFLTGLMVAATILGSAQYATASGYPRREGDFAPPAKSNTVYAPKPVKRLAITPVPPEETAYVPPVFTITAYCACPSCCEKDPSDPWYGITATGTRATEGRTIAVDPKVIPYGTKVRFIGPDGQMHEYIAEDCGGAIKGNRIDLYFDSHQDALRWGVRQLEVFGV